MGSRLSEKDIETIVGILDGWAGKLTWKALQDSIEMRLGRRYSRQALDSHLRIKRAYNVRKGSLKRDSVTAEVKSVEMQKTLERIKRLEAEIQRLKAENNALTGQFVKWAYNAHTRGINRDCLNKPLPPVDRDRTEN